IEIDTKDELGELAESFNSMSESIVANNVSREYFFNILESMREAIIVTDKDGIVQGVNTSTSDLLIFSEPEMRGRTISSFFSTQDTPDRNKKPVEKGQFKESLMITKRGRSIPVLYSENDLLDAKNAVIGKVYVAADMTARKEYEERLQQSLHEKEVLLAEIHHRVKNNLAVISGLLQLQSFSSNNKTVAKALKDSQMRIQSISLVHELLYQNESLAYIQYDRYINDLLQAIQLTHSTPEVDIRLSSQVDPIALGINQAVPCSLLLNELIVNAYKHAFKGIDEGKINIYATMDDDQMVTIKVCDNGVGLDMKRLNESKSLGMTLIKTLTKQLDGTFETGRNPDGPGSYSVYSFKKESIVSDFAG
ncbi:MAG: histidine kinase dimerization/phosphoacceptor domain -containing protein, partial [Bacteroidota bacterium]